MAKQHDSKLGGSKKLKPPKKPYDDFDLTPHASGKWQKKINGKTFYFGRWARLVNKRWERVARDGWREALDEYKKQAEALHTGPSPEPEDSEVLSLAELCNQFLNSKRRKQENGELSDRMFWDYQATTDRLIRVFGKKALVQDLRVCDFVRLKSDITASCGLARTKNEIIRTKSVFKYAWTNALIDKPVQFGSEFAPPSKRVIKREQNSRPAAIYSAQEIHQVLAVLRGEKVCINPNTRQGNTKAVQLRQPNLQLLAMTLLGINTGCGNTDVANLELRQLDLKNGWLIYPRAKTAVDRRVPLWPETRKALEEAIAGRPKPRDKADANCVFLTTEGGRFLQKQKRSRTDYVAREFSKVVKLLELASDGRKRLNFYALRHTLATRGLELPDRDAVKAILGHSPLDVTAGYNHAVPADERLQKVVDHVRSWLFNGESLS